MKTIESIKKEFGLDSLEGADLRGADLEGADLGVANLERANLYGANLKGADLREANLSWANLFGANLVGANLSWADLYGANLREADLREANLRGADLSWANLFGADLYGAYLRGAYLEGANLWNTIGNGKEIISLQTSQYWINYTYNRIQIGCEDHSIEDWANFDDDRIASMDYDALEWRLYHKEWLFANIKSNPATNPSEGGVL